MIAWAFPLAYARKSPALMLGTSAALMLASPQPFSEGQIVVIHLFENGFFLFNGAGNDRRVVVEGRILRALGGKEFDFARHYIGDASPYAVFIFIGAVLQLSHNGNFAAFFIEKYM